MATTLDYLGGLVLGDTPTPDMSAVGSAEVETRRSAKTRVYGCLLTPATTTMSDAAEAAHDKLSFVRYGSSLRLLGGC